MTEKIIIAGFGGQGIILAGKLLAQAGMLEGKYVSHIPSYGVEMRGGTANCSVVISDSEVASPVITHPTTLIVMNQPSLEKYEEFVAPGGNILINESLINMKAKRGDLRAFYVPANNLAEEAGSGKAGNMVMVGAFIAVTAALSLEDVRKSLAEVVSRRNVKLNEINLKALDLGYRCVESER